MNLRASVSIKVFGPGIRIIFLHFLASDKGGRPGANGVIGCTAVPSRVSGSRPVTIA